MKIKLYRSELFTENHSYINQNFTCSDADQPYIEIEISRTFAEESLGD